MAHVIVTTSRVNGELLVMVDRKKQRKSFWSNCLRDAFVYADKEAAVAKAKTFKFNNPRAMSMSDALRQMPMEPFLIDDMDSAELGWDAHKSY